MLYMIIHIMMLYIVVHSYHDVYYIEHGSYTLLYTATIMYMQTV